MLQLNMRSRENICSCSTQLKGEDYVAWTRPQDNREPGRGNTQPSLHLLAVYYKSSSLSQGGSGILARLAIGLAQPVGRPFWCDQVDDEEGGQKDAQYDEVDDGTQRV